MAWRASVAAACDSASLPAHLRAAGAWAFVLSDSFIAVSRFVAPFAGSDVAIFVTYYAAQFLLALTAPGGAGGAQAAAASPSLIWLSGGCSLHRRSRK